MFDKVNQFVNFYIETIRSVGRGRIWLSLFMLSLVNFLVLWAHYDFLSPIFYPVVTFWTNLINEPAARMFTHYPEHFLTLPYFVGFGRLIPGLFIEGLLLGLVAQHFRNAYNQRDGGGSETVILTLRHWFQLIGCWLVVNGLTIGSSFILPDLMQFFHQDSPRRLLAMDFLIIPFILSIILALFYYTMPLIVMNNMNFLKALGRSAKFFFKRPLTTFSMAVMILSGPYLISTIAGRSGDIVSKFKPEMVFWVLVVGLVVELFANFFWMGTAVRFLYEEDNH